MAKAAIVALPQKALLELPIFTAKQRHMLKAVRGVSLHRIYAAWTGDAAPWYASIPKTTTDNRIRQFIPISRDANHAVAMASYSDYKDAIYWHRVANKGTQTLGATLLKYLGRVFGGVRIPYPAWIQSHYWPEGIHVWKPGADSATLAKKITQIMGKDVPFYIVGEAYSQHQGWIEGSLKSVAVAAKRIWPAVRTGGGSVNKAALKSKFPGVEWVLYTDDKGVTHVVDVTKWKFIHPGGNVYEDYLYGKKDITHMFKTVPYHFQLGTNTLKPSVLSTIKKYTIATL
jgi:hypothetical protein